VYTRQIDTNTHWIVLESRYVARLKEHLQKFLALCDTQVKEMHLHVYLDIEEKYKPVKGEILIPQKKGFLVITSNQLEVFPQHEAHTLFRVQNQMPVQGQDFDREMQEIHAKSK